MSEYRPIRWGDSETITVSSVAVGLGAESDDRLHAFITVETNPIRYWIDGSAPTATVGHLLQAGDTLELIGPFELDNVKFIAQSGDATIQVSYGGDR